MNFLNSLLMLFNHYFTTIQILCNIPNNMKAGSTFYPNQILKHSLSFILRIDNKVFVVRNAHHQINEFTCMYIRNNQNTASYMVSLYQLPVIILHMLQNKSITALYPTPTTNAFTTQCRCLARFSSFPFFLLTILSFVCVFALDSGIVWVASPIHLKSFRFRNLFEHLISKMLE